MTSLLLVTESGRVAEHDDVLLQAWTDDSVHIDLLRQALRRVAIAGLVVPIRRVERLNVRVLGRFVVHLAAIESLQA